MSDTLKQIAIAVVTAGAVSFGSFSFMAGQRGQQIKANTDEIALLKPEVAKAAILETRVDNMEKRLETYENLVIEGQEKQQDIAIKILDEMRAMRKETSDNKGKIGNIQIDIQWIKESIHDGA
tara:strand:+ start:254 stop:622 length:369 start_codon:yes stop_codon:yes gene_type:complete